MNDDSYKHPKWQKKRLLIMERDKFRCFACGDSESTLHVHHFAYDGKPWEVADEHLQTLCEECHKYLGPHPKGGVWWIREDTAPGIVISGVFVAWCPQCGLSSLKQNHGGFDCDSCGWSCDRYARGRDGGVGRYWVGDTALAKKMPTEKKPKAYSLDWLRGMMTKVRKSGPSESELFDALFPDFAEQHLFAQLRDAVNRTIVMMKGRTVPVDEECDVWSAVVRARRALKDKLEQIDKGPTDAV